MKKIKILIVCASILTLYGCAGVDEKDKFEDLNRKVTALGSSLDSANSKIEDLNNKVLLLNEKIETMKQNAEAAPAAAAQMPEGLKVVNLGPDGDKKEQPVKAAPDAQPTRPPQISIASEGPEALYKRGRDLLNSGRNAESRAAFSSFLKSYPTDKLANNARYWIGESYYSERAFESALKFFEEVADKYPNDNKAPDCLLKAGLSYIELNNSDKARETLERLVKRYPRSEAAEKAKKTLNKISKK